MLQRPRTDEDGAALVTVIGVTFFLSLLLATLLFSVINVNTATYRDADFHAALGAAEAGIDELIYQLNADPYYWEKIRDIDPDVPATLVPVTDAFSEWVAIPGGDSSGTFRYDATSRVETDGTIEMLVSGRVGERVRTLDVSLRRRSFLDYLYFTEYETRPPAAYNTWPPLEEDREYGRVENGVTYVGNATNSQNYDGNVDVAFVGLDAIDKAEEQCSHHRYSDGRPRDVAAPSAAAGDPNPQLQVPAGVAYDEVAVPDGDPATVDGRNPKCHEPHWTRGDRFQGNFHTNDALGIRVDNPPAGNNSPRWVQGTFTSSWRDAPESSNGWLDVQSIYNGINGATAFFENQDDRLLYADPLRMPPSNDLLRQVAAVDGCLLQGPTRLHLHWHNGAGHIGIHSPLSATGTACGNGFLDDDGRVRIPVDSINNGVLFVENAPQDSCTGTGRAIDLPMGGQSAVGIPAWNAGLEREDVTPYTCWHGDALLSGQLDGRLTIGAGHDVIVVGNVTYRGVNWPAVPPASNSTLLGIIANRFVYLFNPVDCRYWWDHVEKVRNDAESKTVCLHARGINYNGGGGDGGGLQNATVYGAILSVQYAMTTQNSGLGGSKGTLRIMGNIAQRYRGNLGSAAGYYLRPGVGNGQICSSTSGRPDGVAGGYCSAGYGKDFRYDERLQYLSPPNFLSPLETSWGISEYSETDIETFASG